MSRQPTILIIDDVPDNIEVLGDAISSLGDVSFALSGPEGLRLIEAQHPDLVLLDVMMPEMNGYEVFAHLQTSEATAHIPVIFVTAKSDPLSEAAALNAGAIDFISKPINPIVARARVRLHLDHQARAHEVRQLNLELEQRVEERTQALSDALLQSRAAQEAKSLLLANMNHEFRTPLNAMLGMARMATKRVQDPQAQQWLQKIDSNGNQLMGLLSGILDLARIETRQLAIYRVPFNLQAVFSGCAQLHQQRAEAKGLHMALTTAPDLPWNLVGDPVRIGNVLVNLVSNAIKFTSHGSVDVRLSVRDRQGPQFTLRLEVQDTGIGIAAQDQARIFELFEQADGTSTRAYGGAGVGLTICQQLVTLMGGTLGVQSTLGQGSLFWVHIPLQEDTALATTGPGSAGRNLQNLHYLRALLSDDDFTAVTVWETSRADIEAHLGPQADAFAQAMNAFDLAGALRCMPALPLV